MSTFHGGAQGGINSQFAEAVTIPIPPLPEQKRIAAKLDAILSKIKVAKTRLGKVPAMLKKFRQSVLAAACSGRLTADWREGKELRNDFTGDISDTVYDVPENWIWTKLENLVDRFQYGTSTKSENDGAVPVIRMGNLQSGIIDWSDLKYTDNENDIAKYNYDMVMFYLTEQTVLI
jgi:type I restriction enzyme S subunit